MSYSKEELNNITENTIENAFQNKKNTIVLKSLEIFKRRYLSLVNDKTGIDGFLKKYTYPCSIKNCETHRIMAEHGLIPPTYEEVFKNDISIVIRKEFIDDNKFEKIIKKNKKSESELFIWITDLYDKYFPVILEEVKNKLSEEI